MCPSSAFNRTHDPAPLLVQLTLASCHDTLRESHVFPWRVLNDGFPTIIVLSGPSTPFLFLANTVANCPIEENKVHTARLFSRIPRVVCPPCSSSDCRWGLLNDVPDKAFYSLN